jgi:biopolymer transport protein ExbD
VFLVLLIIFMITSSAMLESGMNVKLPTAKSSAISAANANKPAVVSVSKEGTVFVNNVPVPESQLVSKLQEYLKTQTEKTVVIRGDESIFLGKAVSIMDSARNAGAEKIAIATQPPTK